MVFQKAIKVADESYANEFICNSVVPNKVKDPAPPDGHQPHGAGRGARGAGVEDGDRMTTTIKAVPHDCTGYGHMVRWPGASRHG